MSLQTVRPRASTRSRRYTVICADCNESATVPFRPTTGRPVYCRPCFNARRSDKSANTQPQRSDRQGTNSLPDEATPSDTGVPQRDEHVTEVQPDGLDRHPYLARLQRPLGQRLDP